MAVLPIVTAVTVTVVLLSQNEIEFTVVGREDLDHCNNTVEEDGQECYLIVGGITALVDESVVVIDGEGGTVDQSVIEDSVKSDTAILVKDVFSDPGSYESLEGVEEVIFEEIPALPIGTLAPTVSAMPSSSTTDGGIVSPTVSSPTMMPSANALSIASGPTPNGTRVDSVNTTL